MPRFLDNVKTPVEGFKFGMGLRQQEHTPVMQTAHGLFIFDMQDAKTGAVLHHFEQHNIITMDAGIQCARYFRNPNEPAQGANMLAIGTGATGALLSPNAPDSRQRKLNAELARKTFSSTVFRDTSGNAVSYKTNIVDFTATFSEAEAVGPLNEMGIVSTISANPLITNPNPNAFPNRDTTLDLALYDVLINYLTFSVVSKPATAVLTITWRLTF